MNALDPEGALRWLAIAIGDLDVARSVDLERGASARVAVGLAQQAAEKALKAMIQLTGVEPPRTHDLVALARRVPDLDLQVDLTAMSGVVEPARYPGVEDPPFERAEVERLLGDAQAVIEAVQRRLATMNVNVSDIDPV